MMASDKNTHIQKKNHALLSIAAILLSCALLTSCQQSILAYGSDYSNPPVTTAAGLPSPEATPHESEALAITHAPSIESSVQITTAPAQAQTPSAAVSSSPASTTCPTVKPTPKPTPKPARKAIPRKTAASSARPKASPAATAAPATGVKALENKMIALVNKERAKAGLRALKYDSSLRAGALHHSQDMSSHNYFNHTSPTYGSFVNRLKAAGVRYVSAGENIAMFGSVENAHAALMKSSGHKANILGKKYSRIGIGIVYNSSKHLYYITQWFAN
jgi:uncharacterized protein YkwD